MAEPTKNEELSESTITKLRVLSDLVMRSRISAYAGVSFQGNRDLYTVLGYKRDLAFQDYWDAYKRNRLAKRIINAPVESTWYGDVAVYENQEEDETEFEKAWKILNQKHQVISKLIRLDKLVGLGEYAVLLLGFNDKADLSQPLSEGKHELLYIQPYHQGSCTITKWVTDETSDRYAMPEIYTLKLIRPGQVGFYKETTVHASRVIHVSDGCLENDVFGTPRLESVFNSLLDLEKMAGGSAEMFWQGALGGKAFTAKDGATLTPQTIADMGEEIDDYIHGLRRYLRLQNIDVQNLTPDLISSPKDYIDTQLDLISGDTGIPKRILVGSERGELASTQDESNWLSRVEQRRLQYAEPFILRKFVDLMIDHSVLPEPKDGYQVDWPDLWSISEQEQATVAKTKTEALAAYVNAPGAETVVPEEFFLEEFLGFTRDQIERIQEILEKNPPEESTADMLAKAQLEKMKKETEQIGKPVPGAAKPGGEGPGKKPKANEDDDLDDFYIENFNPNHDRLGRFATGPGGAALSDAEAREIASERGYRVPPAWTNVRVNKDPKADLQVVGEDSKGRRVYIYTSEAQARAAAQKFERVSKFSKDHDKIAKRLEKDFDSSDEAKVLYLINKTGFRIGSDKDTKAKVQAFGASTLTSDHIRINGTQITFDFIGKEGVHQVHTIDDARLASALHGKKGRLFNTTAERTRNYLEQIAPGYLVKDFRTHIATGEALRRVSGMPAPKTAKERAKAIRDVCIHVSSILGNTPTMAKNSYIHPTVWGKWTEL